MSKIACLAWGSLVWNPGELPISGWSTDGPTVRVEFLRESDNGLITLVLHETGTLVRSHWAILSVDMVEEAVEALRKRERTPNSSAIGRWSAGHDSPPLIPGLSEWARDKGIASAIWTALAPKFKGEGGRVPTEEEVVSSLRACSGDIRSRAEEYVRRAPPQTRTPYRQRIEAEFGWNCPDFERELKVLREFGLFLDKQLGVYCDCLTGFEGNRARVELVIPRARRPVGRAIKDGLPVIVWASVEDPESPDVIHHRITRAADFVGANSETGFNEQQICWAIITFVFAYWNEEIRPQIARARAMKSDDIKVSEFGDLRILRHNILHNNGLLPANEHAKLLVLGSLCQPGATIVFTHEQMKKLFEVMHQGIAQLVLYHTGHLAGAPRAQDLVKVAFQLSGAK